MEEILLRISLGAIFSLIVSIVSGFVIAYVRSFKSGIKDLSQKIDGVEREIRDIRENLPKEYVLKDDYRRDLQEIKTEIHELREEVKEGFRSIEKKLDQKADKK